MVCNLHFPTGTTYFRFFLEFGIEGHFRRENLVSWLDEKLSLLLSRAGREPTTSRTPRLHNNQGVPHPTRSAIGRRYNNKQAVVFFTKRPQCGLGGGGMGDFQWSDWTHYASQLSSNPYQGTCTCQIQKQSELFLFQSKINKKCGGILVDPHHAGEAIIMLLGNYENFANMVAENIIKTRCIRIKWSMCIIYNQFWIHRLSNLQE